MSLDIYFFKNGFDIDELVANPDKYKKFNPLSSLTFNCHRSHSTRTNW